MDLNTVQQLFKDYDVKVQVKETSYNSLKVKFVSGDYKDFTRILMDYHNTGPHKHGVAYLDLPDTTEMTIKRTRVSGPKPLCNCRWPACNGSPNCRNN